MLENAKVMAVIPFHDLLRAQTFYEKMLGLVPVQGSLSEGEAVYSFGGTSLLIYSTQAELGGATKVSLIVPDLETEMATLKNHGVVFEDFDMPNLKTVNGVAEDAYGKGAWFTDLEGNWLSLREFKARGLM
jgi:catechol-2,3-dioxygenase